MDAALTATTPKTAFVDSFGWVHPADGGPPVRRDAAPQPVSVPFKQVLSALNPVQHLPIIGRIYRAETGDDIPAPLKILGAGIFGGPLGILGAALTEMVTELVSMGPDTSRPAVPAGMTVAGSNAGVQPVSPGTLGKGEYTTLATALPDWLRPSTPEELALVGDPRRGTNAYKAAAGTMFAQASSGGGRG